MFFKTVVTAFVLTAITLMIYPVNAAESEEFVTRNLIGYWTMDRADIDGDTVKDISGNNNHGEIRGNPQIVPGKIGEALDFDGVDDFVALPDLGHEPKVTVEVWARGDRFFRVHGLVSTFGVPHQLPGGVVTFSVRFNRIDLSIKDKGGYTNLIGGSVKPYTWYHFAYTSDVRKPGHELTRYINGWGPPPSDFFERAALNIGASPINLTRLRIGSELKGRYFPGILDEVRIYNRALTPEEIRQNFEYRNNAQVVDARRKLAVTWGVLKTTKH